VILAPSRAVRVFAYPAPVDLRKGYDGLYGLVNDSRKLCKVLVWDGSGLCIFQKRLAKGTFAKLWRDDDQVVRLTQSELALFIEGCTLLDRRSLSPIAIERKGLVSDRGM
jgi:transposase